MQFQGLAELTKYQAYLWGEIENRKLHKAMLDHNLSQFILKYKLYEKIREEVLDGHMEEMKKAHRAHISAQAEMGQVLKDRDAMVRQRDELKQLISRYKKKSEEAQAGQLEAEKTQRDMSKRMMKSMDDTTKARVDVVDNLCQQAQVERVQQEKARAMEASR